MYLFPLVLQYTRYATSSRPCQPVRRPGKNPRISLVAYPRALVHIAALLRRLRKEPTCT